MITVPMIRPATLDCQSCGATVRTLSAREAQQVADRPYDFIVYCPACKADAMREVP